MAARSGPPQRAGQAHGLVRFCRSACLGVVCFVVVAMLVAHGSVQVFAAGAFFAGLGWAVLSAAGRLLARVPWREVAGVAAIAMFVTSVLGEARELPRRWL